MLKQWLTPCRAMLLLLAAGCSGGKQTDKVDTSFNPPPVATAVPSSATITKPSNEPCVHTGLWSKCTVEKRLRQAGYIVKEVEDTTPARAGFSVKPLVLSLGRTRVEAFIYKDEKAVAAEIAKLDTVAVAPRGSTGNWESPPIFLRSGNLIAILLSESPRQAEGVTLALTAGAPQPGSPR